jgi:hypothetical protein
LFYGGPLAETREENTHHPSYNISITNRPKNVEARIRESEEFPEKSQIRPKKAAKNEAVAGLHRILPGNHLSPKRITAAYFF